MIRASRVVRIPRVMMIEYVCCVRDSISMGMMVLAAVRVMRRCTSGTSDVDILY